MKTWYELRKQKDKSGNEYPDWRVRYRIYLGGGKVEQNMVSTRTPVEREAESFAKNLIKARVMVLQGQDVGGKLKAALADIIGRRSHVTIGEIVKEYDLHWKAVCNSKDVARRIKSDFYLVIAYAMDMWLINEGGRRGTKVGEKVPDTVAIDKLSAGCLDAELVRNYFKARAGADVSWKDKSKGNLSINSTLKHVRQMFTSSCMTHIYANRITLPDLTEFLNYPLLKQEDPQPEPLTKEEFEAMLKLFNELEHKDKVDLQLANMILRQTGMRSGTLKKVQGSWIRKLDDGYYMRMGVVKGGTAEYEVPITTELAEKILERGTGMTLLPKQPDTDREELCREHNRLLKGIIGGLGETTQGNHRLRDTVGGVVLTCYGMDTAVEALGHSSGNTTRKHYARLRMDVSDLMKAECVAFERLKRDTTKATAPVAGATVVGGQ